MQQVCRPTFADNVYLSFLLMNTKMPPFNDARVRRAVAMMVDCNRLVQVAGGLGIPATGYVIPHITCFDPNFSGVPAFDPAVARALLAEAGYAGVNRRIAHADRGQVLLQDLLAFGRLLDAARRRRVQVHRARRSSAC